MEFNRNHYLMAGLVVLLLGVQLRMVDSYVLNESTTKFLVARFGPPAASAPASMSVFFPANGPTPRKTVIPPTWIGWLAISIGSVLVLHSLAMKRPDS